VLTTDLHRRISTSECLWLYRVDSMEETPTDTDTLASDALGASRSGGGRAASLANLRPPWRPGQSGNPSGLTKDGRPSRSLRTHLEDDIDRRGGPKWLARKLLDQVARGNAKAIDAVLDRVDPLDTAGAGRVVLEGLRLELTPTGGAQVTMLRQEASGSDAIAGESESRAEGHSTLNSAQGGTLELASGVPSPGATPVLRPRMGVRQMGWS
jgi:hypothetical protein